MRGWAKPVVDTAVIVLIVLAAKTAIAEPYYVPSGSMEPTLQIGDELLATKYPYGYSSASLPASSLCPTRSASSPRCRARGDVVVFRRWPGDRSQIWVKPRRRACTGRPHRHAGRPLWINAAGRWRSSRTAAGEVEAEDGSFRLPRARFIETLPGARSHTIFKHAAIGAFDDMAEIVVPLRPSVRDGRQSRQFGRQPDRGRSGGVGLLPTTDLVGRSTPLVGIVGSRGPAPADLDMAGGFAAVAFFHDGAVSGRACSRRLSTDISARPPHADQVGGNTRERGPSWIPAFAANELKSSGSRDSPHRTTPETQHGLRRGGLIVSFRKHCAARSHSPVAIGPGAATAVGFAGGRASLAAWVDRSSNAR